VVCDKKLSIPNFIVCKKCNTVTQWSYKIIGKHTLDIKSTCCNADVNIDSKMTCSDFCHEIFVEHQIKEKGEFQKIIDLETGRAHAVSTRLIIEKGLTQPYLKNFPLWIDTLINKKRD